MNYWELMCLLPCSSSPSLSSPLPPSPSPSFTNQIDWLLNDSVGWRSGGGGRGGGSQTDGAGGLEFLLRRCHFFTGCRLFEIIKKKKGKKRNMYNKKFQEFKERERKKEIERKKLRKMNRGEMDGQKKNRNK